MCNPAIIAGGAFAVEAGQAVLQHIGQNQAYAANKTAANYNYANRMDVIDQQRVQLDQAKSENVFDTAIAGLKAEGSIAASAGDMGYGHASIASALNADMFGLGREASVEDAADQNQRVQLGNEKTGAAIARTSQINSMSKSSGLQLALGIGKAGVDATKTYMGAGGKF
jgi:hypothetical protein